VVQATASPGRNRALLTPAGREHPMMQLAADADGPESNDKRWGSIPALASVSPLGGPKPGASVLAVTGGPGGAPRALVAVQRFGEGRSMIFTGEASWRWRMQAPTTDQTYERFWRQAVRWLAHSTPDPVSLTVPAAPAPGDAVPVTVTARDAGFVARADAEVEVRVTAPDGRIEVLRADPSATAGEFHAAMRAPEPGVYRVAATARRGATSLGSATATLLVGGVDVEMTDPRLNEETLQRVAHASGGAVIASGDLKSLLARLESGAPAAIAATRKDLWHAGWSFAMLAGLLAAEWLLRRASGLR